jgi:hypothetical protein
VRCEFKTSKLESNLWQFDGTKQPHQKLEAALKKGDWLKADWLKTGESTVHLLDSFTRLVGKTKKTSEVRVFFSVGDKVI